MIPSFMNFYSKFKKNIELQSLLSPKDCLVVGVSGGLDSVVLLTLLKQLSQEWSLEMIVAHVNYHLRGKDSNLDEKWVKALANSMGLALAVKSLTKMPKSNLQEKARDIRYDFFEKIAQKHRAKKIVLAHHADDQVETFLFRWIRGAGPEGLSSMEAFRFMREDSKIKLIRPLLNFTKEDLFDFARERGLHWREDRSNQKTDYLRNYLRKKVLAPLKKIHPKVIEKMLQGIESLQLENRCLEEEVSKKISPHLKRSKNQVRYPLISLKKQLVPVRYRMYTHLFKALNIKKRSLSRRHLEGLDQMVMQHKQKMKLSLPQGWGAQIEGGELHLIKWKKSHLNQRGFFY